MSGWRKLPFERKLLIGFLILALVPALLLVWAQIVRLERSIELWETPGVQRSLESSVTMIRSWIDEKRERNERLTGDAIRLIRGEIEETGLFDPERAIELLDERFRNDAPSFDLYRRRGDEWNLLLSYRMAAGSALWEGPTTDAVRTEPHPSGGSLVAFSAYRIPSDLQDRFDSIRSGYRFYLQLGVYKQIEIGKLWLQTAAIVLLMVLIAFLAARLLARALSRPLLSLVEGTRRVREGDLQVQLPVEAGDELGLLVESFNAMTSDLRDSREKLGRAERVATWAGAARRIAHEIKNPLTPITLSLHRLGKRTDLLPDEERRVARECLQSILEEVENLKNLAGEFSQFSRLPSPKPAPVDLNDLLRKVAPLYLEGQAIDIDWKLADDSPAPFADRELLWRVFSNLIKNAVEAMEGKGLLTLETGVHENRVVAIVADNGPGILEKERNRIFTPYYTRKQEGSGLGLALVDRIIHEHGGSITVDDFPGGGTRFRILLPTAPPLRSTGSDSTIERE